LHLLPYAALSTWQGTDHPHLLPAYGRAGYGVSPARPARVASQHGVSPARPARVASQHGVSLARPARVASQYGVSPARPARVASQYGISPARPARVASQYGVSPARPARVASQYGVSPARPASVASQYSVSPARPGTATSQHILSSASPPGQEKGLLGPELGAYFCLKGGGVHRPVFLQRLAPPPLRDFNVTHGDSTPAGGSLGAPNDIPIVVVPAHEGCPISKWFKVASLNILEEGSAAWRDHGTGIKDGPAHSPWRWTDSVRHLGLDIHVPGISSRRFQAAVSFGGGGGGCNGRMPPTPVPSPLLSLPGGACC
jgi:hypothetical protein